MSEAVHVVQGAPLEVKPAVTNAELQNVWQEHNIQKLHVDNFSIFQLKCITGVGKTVRQSKSQHFDHCHLCSAHK